MNALLHQVRTLQSRYSSRLMGWAGLRDTLGESLYWTEGVSGIRIYTESYEKGKSPKQASLLPLPFEVGRFGETRCLGLDG